LPAAGEPRGCTVSYTAQPPVASCRNVVGRCPTSTEEGLKQASVNCRGLRRLLLEAVLVPVWHRESTHTCAVAPSELRVCPQPRHKSASPTTLESFAEQIEVGKNRSEAENHKSQAEAGIDAPIVARSCSTVQSHATIVKGTVNIRLHGTLVHFVAHPMFHEYIPKRRLLAVLCCIGPMRCVWSVRSSVVSPRTSKGRKNYD